MSTGYQIYNQDALHYLTFTIVDWVDIFTRKNYRDIIIDSLRYCINKKGLDVYGFVIMSNHVHIIARSRTGNLSDTVRDFKKYTANSILALVKTEPESRREWILHRFEWNAGQHQRNSVYQVWMHGSHAEEITTQPFFQQKLDYIHMNPVVAGWVEREEDYLYSSAKALYNNVETFFPLCLWYD